MGMTALGLRNFTWRTLDDIILSEWIGLKTVEQQAKSADWRRRRSRGGMVAVFISEQVDFLVNLGWYVGG